MKNIEAAADIVIRTDEKTVLEICEELITKLTELEKERCLINFFRMNM